MDEIPGCVYRLQVSVGAGIRLEITILSLISQLHTPVKEFANPLKIVVL